MNPMKKRSKKNEEVAGKVFGAKPAFGEIFNLKAIAGLIIVLALIVLGLIFIPRLCKSEKQVEKSEGRISNH